MFFEQKSRILIISCDTEDWSTNDAENAGINYILKYITIKKQ